MAANNVVTVEVERVERKTIEPAVVPYLYRVLWSLAVHGPLTAAEIAEEHNMPLTVRDYQKWTGTDVANRLRGMQKRGIVERNQGGFWSLTEQGRAWMQMAVPYGAKP